jgi:hypothetical protein
MIYDIPHVTNFGYSWSKLKVQWEVVHLTPACNDKAGSLFVYLDIDWLEYIRYMNSPEAFQWMIGDSGTIIWGIKNKKNLADKNNKAKMPVIAVGGNQISFVESSLQNGYGQVVGMKDINYLCKPGGQPWLWHRIWCVTKLKHGTVSAPHDTPHGPAYMPILDVSAFKRTKSLAAGVTYIKVI